MKKNLIVLFVIIFSVQIAHAQVMEEMDVVEEVTRPQIEADPRMTFENTIQVEDLKKHLTIIASDDFGGRELGSEGIDKAADYIANHFKSIGLEAVGDNGYFQTTTFTRLKWDESNFQVNDVTYKIARDYLCLPDQNTDFSIDANEVVFLGYGIDSPAYSDYGMKTVKDKVIMIYGSEPINAEGVSIMGDNSMDIDNRLQTAYAKGAKCVLIIDDELKNRIGSNLRFLLNGKMYMGDPTEKNKGRANSIFISGEVAKELMGKKYRKVIKARNKILKKRKSKWVKLTPTVKANMKRAVKSTEGVNCVGFLEGSDPIKKKEVVIVTAHFDHLGQKGDGIYNGADDNGSGTTAVLELSEAFALAKKSGNGPDRSILFMTLTGEEKGLLGSRYYVENPIFPIENSIVNVNIDMIGRIDKKYKDQPNYIYVIGSDRMSTHLHDINEEMNASYTNLTLDYTYNDENDPNRYYYRSDHYNFAVNGIPAIFFFNGTHADYHRTSDTVEKIAFDKMANVIKLIYHTTWELANRPERITVNVPQKP